MDDFKLTVFGEDDGDQVLVSTASWLRDTNYGCDTPIRIVSSDYYSPGAGAYLTIEQAKQHIEHVRQAIEFLENP